MTPDDRTGLAAACHQVAGSGLVLGGSGNVSTRRGDEVLITRQGARLASVGPDDCVRISLTTGEPLDGGRPSSEAQLHCGIYRTTDALAVVHTHSHFATALGTVVDLLPAVHYGINAFGGPVRVAPYATFGSPELAASVSTALEGRSGALLANHGAVATASSLPRAVELAVLLEWLCSVYVHARQLGNPSVLTDEQLAEARSQSRRLDYQLVAPA